jgi:phosphodiesterase/alkaline phosphatase D-like protein
LVSNTIAVTTTAPVAPTATNADNFTCVSFNANWGAVTGATSYSIEVSTDASFSTYQTGYNNFNIGNVTTYNVSGLTIGANYFYRIKASNGCSTSLVSNTIAVTTTAPVAPTATDANNFTCNSFNANWGAVTGATSYSIEVSTSTSFSTYQGTYNNFNVGNVTTLNITGLTTGVTYFYRIKASNGCSTSLVSNTITVGTTAPVAPNANPADNFTCNSFNANWGAVTGATSYIIEVSTNTAFSTYQGTYNNFNVGNVTTLNITGLTTGVTYFYRIKASNGCSTSLVSNTITVGTTAPVAPTATDANNFTCNSFNANWGAVTGATSYIIEVSTNTAFSTYQGTYNNFNVGNVTTLNITGLTTGVTYFYRIKASNGCSTSLVSNTITVGTTAPVAPTATDANNFTCNSFNANWGAVTGATSYVIEVSTNTAFSTYQSGYNNLNVGNVTTLNVGGLTTGLTYFYRIKASNGCSTSLNSNTITVGTTAPVAPTATDANNFTCNSFNANWGAVTGATSYILEVSTNASFSTFQGSYNSTNNVGNVTTLNVTGLTTGLVYYYRIRASNGCSVSLNSNTVIVSTTAPVSPTATPATNFTCTSFNANWGAVSGATSYIVDVSTSSSFLTTLTGYTNLSTGNVTTLNVTNLGSNTTYYYRIKSTNGCSTSLPSNTVSVGTSAPIAPVAIAASNFTCTSFNANWATVTGATQYFIDVSSDANFTAGTILSGYNNLNVANVNTFIVTGLTINTTYYYRVRADNGCSFSANSNTINVTTTSPIAPIALNADNFSCTTFNANWSASIGATSYELDVATTGSFSPGSFVLSAFNVGNATTYNVIGLAQNTTYFYRIRSVNGCATSGNSNIVVVTISAPIAPNAIDASNITCTSLNANWGVSSGATGYYLDVATTANFAAGSFITPYNNAFMGNTNTYNIIGLTQGVTYFYRVRAINGCATSVNSNSVTASTTAPSAPIALNGSNFTCTSFNANWSPVLGAVAYYLDVATDAGFAALLPGYANLNVGTANTYPITGLAQNANYYYRVRAANICSTSTSSNSTTVTTSAPIAPTSSGSSNLTCTSFNANWGATVGATAYYLDVSTDANYGTFLTANGTTYNAFNVNNVTTYNITGLVVNTTYYYRVRAGNGCSISLTSNNIMTVTSAPFAPIAVAPSDLNCTSFNANWGGSVGAITYYLDVSTSATFANYFSTYNNTNVGNVTTYPISGLAQGATYYFRVRAASGCTTSPNSNTVSATIAAPSAPAALPATNVACVSFNANWASVSGATSYIIDASTSSSFATFLTGYNGLNTNGNVTTYNIAAPEVVQGGTYYYRVRAVNGCSTSGNSNLVSVTTAQVNAPVALSASDIACTVFNANWTAVGGVTGYLLDVSTSASFATTFVTGLSVGNVLTYNVTGLSLNTTYYYRVRATSACATSTNSNTISAATTAPAAPNASAASNVTCTSMNINWSAVSGVIGYYIDVSTDGNFGSFISPYGNYSVGNVTTYNVTGLPGTTVYYRVRSATACTQSINSNFVTVNPSAISPPTVGLATGVACTTFNANWSAVGGALSYELDVSTSASFATTITAYSALNVGNVTSYNVSGLSVNNTYYYRVRSKNACVTSTNSTTQVVSTNAPAPPTVSVATNVTCTSMNANWTGVPVSGAITYYLDVSSDANFSPGTFILQNQDVGGASVNTYNVTGLTGGTVYYRLRSASACASGGNSAIQMVNPSAIASPTANPANPIACSNFNANWVNVTGALSYQIDVSTSASFTTYILNHFDVGNNTTYNVTGVSVNNLYYYRVYALNACVISPPSGTITANTSAPAAPAIGVTTNITCTSFNVNWAASNGAITYYLDISTDVNFATYMPGYQNKDVGNAITYNATGITGNPPYYFRMRAASGCASGGNSVVTSVNPASLAPPAATAATGITCNVFNANWNAVSGALTYSLDISTSAAFGAGTFILNGQVITAPTVTYNATGLTINTTYYYRVRANNACTSSNSSNIITVSTTAPNAPATTAVTNLTCGGFNANWTAVTGALDYFLDVSTDQTFSTYLIGYQNKDVGYTSPVSYAVSGLSQNTIYYYRVRALNGCTLSGNSDVRTVATSSPTAPGIPGSVTTSTCSSFLAQWTAVGGATSYQIDVSQNDPTFAPGSLMSSYNNLNVGNVLSVTVNGVVPGIVYYYRVRSVNLCGISGNSGSLTFKIEPPAIPSPGLTNPGCTTYGVSWPLVSSASGYRIDVSTDPGFSGGSFLGTYNDLNINNVSSYGLSGLVDPPGEYYFRMRATNTCGTSGNSPTLTIITHAPDAPNTNGIIANPITCNTFTAIWGSSVGATAYLLDVSTASNFSTLIYNQLNVGNVSQYNVVGLSPGQYYYRVRGYNSCGTPVVSSTVNVLLGTPNTPVVAAVSGVGNTTFTANWNASTSGNATTYYLDVSTDPSFGAGNFLSGYNSKNVGNVTSYTVTGLVSGWSGTTTYYYRVRGSNSCGTSGASGSATAP